MSSTFNILTRIRPPSNLEKRCVYSELNEKTLYVISQKRDVLNNIVKTRRNYTFDKVYDIDYTNSDIFEDIKPLLEKIYSDRKNTTLFMYGQTGSGKTHTIMGYNDEKGLLNEWLYFIKEKNEKNITVTCVQIYNDICHDIFNLNERVTQLEDKNGKIHLRNCKKIYLDDISIKELIEKIKTNRIVGISSENDTSSRSHLLIQIWLNNNYINILDLAGSEKAVNNICSNREQMRENAKINKSIMVLKECIRAVKSRQPYIPFRQCNLTKILKDTFLNNSVSFVIATLSPEIRNVNDTLNALGYISDMKSLKRQVSEPILLKIPEKKNKIVSDDNVNEEIKNEEIKNELDDLHSNRVKYYKKYKEDNSKYNKDNFKLILLNEINILNKMIRDIENNN
jgi:kinesin family member 2/24